MTDFNSLLSDLTAASIVDAVGRTHSHRAHILELTSPTPGRVLFGQAATMSFYPVRADLFDEARHSFAAQFYKAVGEDSAGKVLVMASNGHPEISLGGGTKLSRLANQGLAGLLCDGRIRDFSELADYDIAFYCKGETTRWGGDVVVPFTAGGPIVIDGVTVVPGDYIYADAAGAVIIPQADIVGVLEEAARIEQTDADFLEQIRDEDPTRIGRDGSAER
jgi:regulator of RNase E activity RraA